MFEMRTDWLAFTDVYFCVFKNNVTTKTKDYNQHGVHSFLF